MLPLANKIRSYPLSEVIVLVQPDQSSRSRVSFIGLEAIKIYIEIINETFKNKLAWLLGPAAEEPEKEAVGIISIPSEMKTI